MHFITWGSEDRVDPREHPPHIELEVELALGDDADWATLISSAERTSEMEKSYT